MELADYRDTSTEILTAQLAKARGTAVFRGTPLDNRFVNASTMCVDIYGHTQHTAFVRLVSTSYC